MADTFVCAIEVCGFKAPAERMWNLDRKETNGKLVILCGKDAHTARERGLKAYRFAETLRRDAERQAKAAEAREKRDEFFSRFGRTRLSDAIGVAEKTRAERNGHQPQTSPVLPTAVSPNPPTGGIGEPQVQEATS